MKSMEQFGKQLLGYEGITECSFEEGEVRIDCSGDFEAAQFPSGRLVITVVPARHPHPTKVTLRNDPNSKITFSGNSLDGWSLRSGELSNFSRLAWMLSPSSPQPTELSFHPQYITARRKEALEEGYNRAQFTVCNLLWHNGFHSEPEPLKLKALEYDVTITPVDNYAQVAASINYTHEIEPTAFVSIEAPGSSKKLLESFKDLTEELLYVFRLVTGNLVTWYYGEAVDEHTRSPIERVHQYAVPRPHSSTLNFRPLRSGQDSTIPKLDLQTLTEAFFSDSERLLDASTLKPLINQFTNSCDQTSYLESRGLLASTLTELLAAKLADRQGNSEAIPQQEYESEHLPILREAIDNTSLSSQIKHQVKGPINGAYRTSFRQRLRSLNDSLDMGLDSTHIDRVVRIRNSLVHNGSYESNHEDGGWLNDYRFVTWHNFCALCRLVKGGGKVDHVGGSAG